MEEVRRVGVPQGHAGDAVRKADETRSELQKRRARDGTGREAPSVSGKTKERSIIWSSEEGLMVDASEPHGEEGRDKLRKAAGRSTYPEIRG